MARTFLTLIVSAVFASFLVGCGGSYLNENDKLRESNQQLQAKVDELEKSIDLRLREIDSMKPSTQPGAKIEGADVPRLVKITFGSYSGPVDTKHNGTDGQITLYILTEDQQGRFIPVSGQATVQCVDIRPNQAPATLYEKTYSAKELDGAYRTGITGTHYTMDVPLPDNPPAGLTSVTVKLTVTDVASGMTFATEQAFSVDVTSRKP